MTRPIRPALLLLTALAVLGALAGPAHADSRAATHIVQLRDGVGLAEGERSFVRRTAG